MLVSMDDGIPVTVRMRVECEYCGHHENEDFAFDMPRKKAQPMEEYVPGKCPGVQGADSDEPEADRAKAVGSAGLAPTGDGHAAAH